MTSLIDIIIHITDLPVRLFFLRPMLPVTPTPDPSILSDTVLVINVALGRDVDADGALRFLKLLPSALSDRLIATTCGYNLLVSHCSPFSRHSRDLLVVVPRSLAMED
jgi:hypothetical protein